jgi:hypothetical protein
MKGGSVSLVLLDVLLLRALATAHMLPQEHPCQMPTVQLLCEYQRVHTLTYASVGITLPRVMSAVANGIRRGGRLFYVGSNSSATCMGMIDLRYVHYQLDLFVCCWCRRPIW